LKERPRCRDSVTTMWESSASKSVLMISASTKPPGSTHTQLGLTITVSDSIQGSSNASFRSPESATLAKVVPPNL